MLGQLVVIQSFQNYKVGDLVSDEAEKANIKLGEHANRTVRVLSAVPTDDQSEDN